MSQVNKLITSTKLHTIPECIAHIPINLSNEPEKYEIKNKLDNSNIQGTYMYSKSIEPTVLKRTKKYMPINYTRPDDIHFHPHPQKTPNSDFQAERLQFNNIKY